MSKTTEHPAPPIPVKNARFSMRIPANIRKELQVLADREHRTLGFYINLVLAEHLKAKGPK